MDLVELVALVLQTLKVVAPKIETLVLTAVDMAVDVDMFQMLAGTLLLVALDKLILAVAVAVAATETKHLVQLLVTAVRA